MKKLIAIVALAATATAHARDGRHRLCGEELSRGQPPGKGPDPTKIYCYDNLDPSQIVKIFSA